MSDLNSVLLLLGALGAGLNAGFFFAFSILVMPAFARLTPAEGVKAMQIINVVVLNPWFFVVFFGAALVSVALAVTSLSALDTPRGAFASAGAGVFLIGTIGVTMLFNVPLNNELAKHDADSETAGRVWRRYLTVWTGWNHVRTLAPLGACALFILALAQPA